MDVREKLVELLKEIVAIQECGFGDPRPTYETVASYLMSHGVTVQEWISVDDRLPEKNNKWVTNAQKIRSMSDEELAVFVRSIIIAEDCPAPGCDCDKCFFKEPCFNGSKWHGKEIEWLKQPAE